MTAAIDRQIEQQQRIIEQAEARKAQALEDYRKVIKASSERLEKAQEEDQSLTGFAKNLFGGDELPKTKEALAINERTEAAALKDLNATNAFENKNIERANNRINQLKSEKATGKKVGTKEAPLSTVSASTQIHKFNTSRTNIKERLQEEGLVDAEGRPTRTQTGATHKSNKAATKAAKDAANNQDKQEKKTPRYVTPASSPEEIRNRRMKIDGDAKVFKLLDNSSDELCFRMDFVKFNRSDVFKPIIAEPADTFILPLPKAIGTGQGVTYTETELGLVGQAETQIRNASNFDTSDVGNFATQVSQEIAKLGASAVYRGLLNADAGKAASLALGFIPNPHLATIFSGVPRRQFSFQVSVAPKSETEAKKLVYMLDSIRAFILPRMTPDRSYLDYPYEVALSFSERGSSLISDGEGKTPLDQIFKFKRCVCTNMDVQVNGTSGTQAFFKKGPELHPIETTITFNFSEVNIQTSEDYGNMPYVTSTAGQDFKDSVGSAGKYTNDAGEFSIEQSIDTLVDKAKSFGGF